MLSKVCGGCRHPFVRVGAEAAVKPLTDAVVFVLSILVGEDGGNGAGSRQ
jgi:hypothetical protein